MKISSFKDLWNTFLKVFPRNYDSKITHFIMIFHSDKISFYVEVDDFYNWISWGMLEPPVTCLTCKTENQMVIVKSLTPGGASQRNSNGQVSMLKKRRPVWVHSRIQRIMEWKKMLPWLGVYGAAVTVGKTGLALRWCRNPRVRWEHLVGRRRCRVSSRRSPRFK